MMVTAEYAKARISNARPCRASTNNGAISGAIRKERGAFISSLDLHWVHARCVQASRLKKNGVWTSCAQEAHFAIDQLLPYYVMSMERQLRSTLAARTGSLRV